MIAVLIANGFEEIEALTPVDVLRRAGLDVKTVSITDEKTVIGSHGIPVVCDALAKDINVEELTSVVFPGGMPGSTNLDASPYSDKFIDAVLKNDGIIGAICAAPLVLGRRGLLKDKKAICFPGFEDELIGAKVLEKAHVVKDGNTVTAKSMEYALPFAYVLAQLIMDDMNEEDLSEAQVEYYEKMANEKFEEVVIIDQQIEVFEELVDMLEAAGRKYEEGPEYTDFKLPDISVFKEGEDDGDSVDEEIRENADKLMEIFENFKLDVSIGSVSVGPRVTKYELVPAKGVKVRDITDLLDDIRLSIAVEGIRMEAPIPGKSAIGIEIPNKRPSTVRIRELLESDEFKEIASKTAVCIGKDTDGSPVFADVAKLPHLIVAGATGMGKSVFINSIIASILTKATPDEVKFILIDPKSVEFAMYNGIPNLLMPVITRPEAAVGALRFAVKEMERRYELLAENSLRSIDAYNERVKADSSLGRVLPKIIIVIDELNDLMQQVRKPIEALILNISQKARAAGIHIIIGTQRPTVDVLTGVIKANVPSRVAFKVTSRKDSRTVLEREGAENLLALGDMLYHPVGSPAPKRVQGAFVSDGEIEKLVELLKEQKKEPLYANRVITEVKELIEIYENEKAREELDECEEELEEVYDPFVDDVFLKAVDIALEAGKISTSLIQRKLGVGYSRAAIILDSMEEIGIVSEPNGQKPRDVLITKDDWKEFLNRRSLD